MVQTYLETGRPGELDGDSSADFAPRSETDALPVANAARAGDPRGKRAFSVLADKLGFALAQVACIVDPDVILIGGGLSAAADLYLDDLRAAYRSYAFGACASTEIRTATLLGDAGVIGAARLAMLVD